MPTEPLLNCTYAVEVDGVEIATFKEASGLGTEVTVVENQSITSTGKPWITKMPGPAKWSDVVLKRGITDDAGWWEWIKLVQEGKITQARRNASITLQDTEHQEKLRFNILHAWPSKVTVSGLAAGGTEVAVEEATLVHEGIEVVK